MSEAFRPAARLSGFRPYRPRASAAPKIKVDANEAFASDENLTRFVSALEPDALNRYTRPHALEADLAARHGVTPDRVAVTAGADDGLLRLCLMTLEPGSQAILTQPTFEMLPRYVALAGGQSRSIEWFDQAFPTDAFVQSILQTPEVIDGTTSQPSTRLAFLVSPSSPAGEVVDGAILREVAVACAKARAVLVLDHAYVEFADDDLTDLALTLPNTVVARTLSKAWGLAGLRVGYFLGPVDVIEWMKTVGQPYAVSTPSVAVARAMLAEAEPAMRGHVERVKGERAHLFDALNAAGARPLPSQGNFVLARLGERGAAFARAMADRGIGVRWFDGPSPLGGAVRITCPGDEAAFTAILEALPAALEEA